ncbi:MBL fold metallo-hydrolase [Stygiolobus azoricus]|uniref:Metallo-beta-lactamase domain-containing protein n=1 Tax=Stygiolobus azoricus TaxID=41675 RepID=A0A650CMW9_9CREN|nr:MBL fold metallo-hydrolase [Stygiolobus azoricus]QGR18837.1 hypothetical protein D1868_01745 [Stygiolobus azoricus]
MISKLVNNVYAIKGNFLVYLIDVGENFILIDSSDGSDSSIIIDGIYEILERNSKKLKWIILTSYKREVAGGASVLSRLFSALIISSREVAPLLRKGGDKNSNYEPLNVTVELSESNLKYINEILGVDPRHKITVIKSNTPVSGSIFIMLDPILFTGASRTSGIKNKISYICNAYNFEKVI